MIGPTLIRLRLLPIAGVGVILAACASIPTVTVTGEIDDAQIRVDLPAAPRNVWFELNNVGSLPCDLVVIVTEVAADSLPIANDQVNFDGLGAGSAIDFVDSAVQPGTLARWQEQLDPSIDAPAVRIIVCNNPGDYAAGRYVIVPIGP